jgi:dienelactone hydrolase
MKTRSPFFCLSSFCRRISVLAALLSQAVPGAGADDLTVLPALVDGVAPTALLEEQLKKSAFAALDRRDTAYALIKTPADVAAWQQRQRTSFLAALGGLPERTRLKARVTGQRDCGAYRMEKILFESQPGFIVSGLLYLPPGAGPHPAVLMPCGHTDIAKAGDVYQKASISLVYAGLAVFCFDPIGQGERRHYRQPDGTPEFSSPTSEHQLMGIAGTPVGLSLARAMIWDGIRALDYLQSRQDIRGDRLGCTGVSGGGTMTSYLMALDERRCRARLLPHRLPALARNHRPAGLRAESLRSAHRRPRPVRLRPHARSAAGAHHGGDEGFFRHPGRVECLPRGQARLRAARVPGARRAG